MLVTLKFLVISKSLLGSLASLACNCGAVYIYCFKAGVFVCVYACSSDEWQKISKKEREKLGIKVEDDGEFW